MFVCLCAPVFEELLFRGFVYTALRNRLGVASAALLDGVLFALPHYSGTEHATDLPAYGAFGVAACLLYERTGSLFPAIALHAVGTRSR